MKTSLLPSSSIRRRWTPSTAHVLETSPAEGDGMYQYAHYVEYAVQDIVDCFLELNGWRIPAKTAAKWRTSCAPAAIM